MLFIFFCKTFLKPLKKSKRLVQYKSNEDRHHAMKVLMLFPSTNVCFVQKYSCLDVWELFKKHEKKMWMNMLGAPPSRVQKGHYLASIRISEKLQFLFSYQNKTRLLLTWYFSVQKNDRVSGLGQTITMNKGYYWYWMQDFFFHKSGKTVTICVLLPEYFKLKGSSSK